MEYDLTNLINRYSVEQESNTPDFILAQYLLDCLEVYNNTIKRREDWYGKNVYTGTEHLNSNKIKITYK